MVPKWTSKYVAQRAYIGDLRYDQQGDRVIPRCYQQFFWYWYFAGIRFAGFLVFRSVSFPPFLYTSPLSSPLFSKKGLELLKKGAIAPLLRKKGATAPFLIPKSPDRVFLGYGIGNTGDTDRIPTENTELVSSSLGNRSIWQLCTVAGSYFWDIFYRSGGAHQKVPLKVVFLT